jgi:hypothetical protein
MARRARTTAADASAETPLARLARIATAGARFSRGTARPTRNMATERRSGAGSEASSRDSAYGARIRRLGLRTPARRAIQRRNGQSELTGRIAHAQTCRPGFLPQQSPRDS